MKKVFLILIGLLFSLSLVQADDNNDGASGKVKTETAPNPSPTSPSQPFTSNEVKDSDKSEIEDLRKKNDTLLGTMVEKDEKIKSLKEEKDNEIKSLKEEISNLENESKSKDARISELEEAMLFIASNFLYIPYEDYNINNIAIPASKYVKDPTLNSKYRDRIDLLKDYAKHVTDLRVFLESLNKEMEKMPIPRKNTDVILSELPNLSVYKDYTNKYKEYWQETYLGKILFKVENKIKEFNHKDGQKDVFTSYIKELKNLECSKQ